MFTGRLEVAGIRTSMDGRGRCMDNIFVQRLWRSVKYEEVYLKDYETVPEAVQGLGAYFTFYNRERLHQSLDYRTPERVYRRRKSSLVWVKSCLDNGEYRRFQVAAYIIHFHAIIELLLPMNKYQHNGLYMSLSMSVVLHLMAEFTSQPAPNAFDLAHGFPPPLGLLLGGGNRALLVVA